MEENGNPSEKTAAGRYGPSARSISSLAETSPAGIVFKYFGEIAKVPRPSGHEEKIREYLLGFASKHALEASSDSAGNVRIKKPGAAGRESDPVIVLQAHMDMVCEKETGYIIDFQKDPIKAYRDGDLIRAEGTTLGADNGIGMALILGVLASDTDPSLPCGPIEALFTVDEEVGCSGAKNLAADWLSGKYLINLDWGEDTICLGCAGSVKTRAVLTADDDGSHGRAAPEDDGKETAAIEAPGKEREEKTYRLTVDGLLGGHSGTEIHLGRANALKILTRLLMVPESVALEYIGGGNLPNAVPRHAEAVFRLPGADAQAQRRIIRKMETLAQAIRRDYEEIDPHLRTEIREAGGAAEKSGAFAISETLSRRLLKSLCACPCGVISMSPDGSVRTSINPASVRQHRESGKKTIEIVTLQRSFSEAELDYVSRMAESVFELAGAVVTRDGTHPGWSPDRKTALLKKAIDVYKDLFGKEPELTATHAGLECGCFRLIRPDIEMISIGPSISGEHTPGESLSIASVEKMWAYLRGILQAGFSES